MPFGVIFIVAFKGGNDTDALLEDPAVTALRLGFSPRGSDALKLQLSR